MRVPGPIVDLGTKKTYIFEFCVFFTFRHFSERDEFREITARPKKQDRNI